MSPAGFPRTPPGPGPVAPFAIPTVHAARLDSGLELRVARRDGVPLVTALLVMDAGEATLAGEQAGLAVLTGKALHGGTARRSAVELACALEDMGTHLATSVGWDSTVVSLTCAADRFPRALRLLSEVVLTPGFPDEEVERTREQQLGGIRQRRMYPAQLATAAAAHFFFGKRATYGRPMAGTEGTVAGLERTHVAGFAAGRFRPRGAALVVAGDVSGAAVTDLSAECFGGWRGQAAPVEATAGPRFGERRFVIVHRPGAVQSELRIGHASVARTTPDYFPLIVLNAVLGGAFTSRLNLNLREDKGFTYGVSSHFLLRRAGGMFRIATAVATEDTAAAVREVLAETETLVADGPTPAEVRGARDYLAGIFPLRLETTAQVASGIARMFVHGLAPDYHARYRDRVRAVQVDDAAGAARRRIRPDALTVVVAGDADRVAPELESLGPIEVHHDF
ncbi:MAG: pitrilysin family protein [Gammaproteobacteria bacterium]|nr:pitrilysin family protein [Gammaproteobacteria bacterium]